MIGKQLKRKAKLEAHADRPEDMKFKASGTHAMQLPGWKAHCMACIPQGQVMLVRPDALARAMQAL